MVPPLSGNSIGGAGGGGGGFGGSGPDCTVMVAFNGIQSSVSEDLDRPRIWRNQDQANANAVARVNHEAKRKKKEKKSEEV